MTDPIFDHETLDIDRLSVDCAGGAYRIAKTFRGPVAEKAAEYEYRSAEYE